jgi:DNA invertase Pin-like site-specific DNA recombinase
MQPKKGKGPREVSDPGWSGAYLDRPGLDHVRDLVQSGSIDVVLAQDRDRIVMEPAYHYLLKREFAEQGCRLKALNDRGDDSPEGELTDGILDQLARYERARAVPTASATTTPATTTSCIRRGSPSCAVSSRC